MQQGTLGFVHNWNNSRVGSKDIRLYTAEIWAKYTGAASYDQYLHRDFLNHTLLVPDIGHHNQVEMFVFLEEVPESLGPPHFVSNQVTKDAQVQPNWITRRNQPDWYAGEQTSTGPAGTVVAFGINTFHRATELKLERGRRITLQVGFRVAEAEWASRLAWANSAYEQPWCDFVAAASLRQLLLFGFPPPGHRYWTEYTLAAVAQRYPGLDVTPFRT